MPYLAHTHHTGLSVSCGLQCVAHVTFATARRMWEMWAWATTGPDVIFYLGYIFVQGENRLFFRLFYV